MNYLIQGNRFGVILIWLFNSFHFILSPFFSFIFSLQEEGISSTAITGTSEEIISSDKLNPFLTESDDSKLMSVLKNLIYNKPERHFFDINEKSYIKKRFMNTTGG